MPIEDRIFPELSLFPDPSSRDLAWRAATTGGAPWFFACNVAGTLIGLLLLSDVIAVQLASPSWPAYVQRAVNSIPLGLTIFTYACTVWLFRRSIRSKLRGELRDVGVRLCLQCGYRMPISTLLTCAECGTEVAPLNVAVESTSPDGSVSLEISAPRVEAGGLYARITDEASGTMGIPFGYSAPICQVSLDWSLPDSVLGIFIAGKCYLLFRWGPSRRYNREMYRLGADNAFTAEEIELFCSRQQEHRRPS